MSDQFPYLPLTVTVRGIPSTFNALLDSGFEGHLVVPGGFFPATIQPSRKTEWALADGSRIIVPTYWGIIQLGDFPDFPGVIIALGDEFIIGRGVSDRFAITLDQGQRLIVEP